MSELWMTTSLAHSAKNDTRLDDALKAIEALGADEGKGRDGWAKFLMLTTELAHDGVVDLTDNKHGGTKDDSMVLTERYIKGRTGASVHDHKAGNVKKAVSCTRTMVKVGCKTGLGTGEPLASMNNLVTIRNKLKVKESKRLDDLPNTLLRWARKQIKANTAFDTQELTDLCYRKQQDLKNAEEVLDAIRKSINNLYNGKASQGTARDSSPFIKTMLDAANARMREIANAKRGATVVGSV